MALVLKLTLAPALVAAATFVARRLGNRAAGLVSGLPVVAAPIVLVYAVEQGEPFARVAAQAAVLGIISQVAFCVAYSLVALRAPVWPALAAGWLAFALGTLALSDVHLSLVTSTLITLAVVAGGAWLVGRLATGTPEDRSGGDLLAWRLLITAALVLALTAAAGGLSAHLAGLLVPFPIITAVLAGFTHVRSAGGGGRAAQWAPARHGLLPRVLHGAGRRARSHRAPRPPSPLRPAPRSRAGPARLGRAPQGGAVGTVAASALRSAGRTSRARSRRAPAKPPAPANNRLTSSSTGTTPAWAITLPPRDPRTRRCASASPARPPRRGPGACDPGGPRSVLSASVPRS